MSSLTSLTRLLRLPLAMMVAVSALAGALAIHNGLSMTMLWSLGWGIFLLTASCSVCNQVQERMTDALMTRTCHRPLACGLISARSGTIIGLALGSLGLAVLLVDLGVASALLGLGTMAWYLCIYTPLKRISSLAVIAGTPCGMVPPLLGWQAAGGDLFAPQALALALLMFLWQVPHYWLLALPDRHELEIAGFKVLPATLTNQRILNLCHFWIMGLVTAGFLLPILHLVETAFLQGLLVGFSLVFAVWTTQVQKRTLFVEKTTRKLRIGLHIYLSVLFILLLTEGVWARLVS